MLYTDNDEKKLPNKYKQHLNFFSASAKSFFLRNNSCRFETIHPLPP